MQSGKRFCEVAAVPTFHQYLLNSSTFKPLHDSNRVLNHVEGNGGLKELPSRAGDAALITPWSTPFCCGFAPTKKIQEFGIWIFSSFDTVRPSTVRSSLAVIVDSIDKISSQ